MLDMIIGMFQLLFEQLNSVNNLMSLNAVVGGASQATILRTFINNVAVALQPIGLVMLAMFAMIEFATLSERVGNINGFMGTGLVIEVLIKIVLCKLVLDNSVNICNFLLSLGDKIEQAIGSQTISGVDFDQLKANISSAFPDWWDILGQIGFFIVSSIFLILCCFCIMIVTIIFSARLIEILVYTAVSPIPLSTCLSKHFNMAPNFIKTFLAVVLQGGLLLLLIKIFTVIFVSTINGLGTLSTGDWGALWGMLGSLLATSILFLVCSFQTQRWAKSICHAM